MLTLISSARDCEFDNTSKQLEGAIMEDAGVSESTQTEMFLQHLHFYGGPHT